LISIIEYNGFMRHRPSCKKCGSINFA